MEASHLAEPVHDYVPEEEEEESASLLHRAGVMDGDTDIEMTEMVPKRKPRNNRIMVEDEEEEDGDDRGTADRRDRLDEEERATMALLRDENDGSEDEQNLADIQAFAAVTQQQRALWPITREEMLRQFPGGPRGYRWWKWGSAFYAVYLFIICGWLLGGLVLNGGKTCSKPLTVWASIEAALLLLQAIKSTWLHFRLLELLARSRMGAAQSRLARFGIGTLYLSNRVLNFVWFVWLIFGAVWTLDDSSCYDDARTLYITTLAVVVLQMSILGLLITIGFLGCCGLLVLAYTNPSYFSKANKGASKRLIESKTKRVKFDPEDPSIDKDDAMCAICLSEYSTGDEIRYLPCAHHFHSECVDQWLVNNKSCARCRRLIDARNSVSK